MKVLFVSSGTRYAGPNPIVLAQGESLKRMGVNLDYFAITRKGAKGYALAIRRLRKALKKSSYDIIHAHYGLAAVVAFLARRREKLVVSFMGDDLVGSNRPDGRLTRVSLLMARFNAFLACNFYSFSVVKSPEMRKALNGKRAYSIPNGVDLQLFRPESKSKARKLLDIPKEASLVIFVSKPDRAEKNFALAEQAVAQTGIPGIKLIPLFNLPQKELAHYYNAADVLLLTSFHEGSPNVIKEAMACNCPAVSTNVGDVRWVMGNTEGYYIASYDPGDFSKKIRLALEFSKKRGRTTGRARIVELGLDSATVARRIIALYQKVMGQAGEMTFDS